ncbi:MAG TPA: hypothetical protein VN451_06210, partial [Chitinophagaceae bacterium]|nr:hypothetical protein [Chitinophagaceae bacterium]
MPVDATMLDAMLGTFRNMLKECRDKNMSGDDFDQMDTTMRRMEHLGQEMSDVGAFSGQLMQEGLFMKFSDHYGKLLASSAQQQSSVSSGVYDENADKALLQQTINAYKDAIQRLKDSKEETKKMLGANAADADVLIKDKAIIDSIENVIRLGESGISYPAFLTEMMKQGLDKAMEGSALSRDAQLYLCDAAKATAASPFYIQKEEEKLVLFDALAKASKANVPNNLQYTLGCEKIEWKYQPDINKWNKIKEAWEKAIFWLDEWITSYCSFAPHIEPWAQSKNPKEAVIESQDCVPGKLRVWENINQCYFNLSLPDLFRHKSFAWDVENHWMYWSQEYMEFLLKKVEPICTPDAKPDTGLITEAENFHREKKKINPAVTEPSLRYAKYFDSYFGAGEYEKRFGMPANVETNAAPWKW